MRMKIHVDITTWIIKKKEVMIMWQDVLGLEEENCRSANRGRDCECRRRRQRPIRDIEDTLLDILDSVNDIEECTCNTIVRLLRRILDAVEDNGNNNNHCRCRN